MKQHSINSHYDFIQGYFIDDNKLCYDLIAYFHASPEKRSGSFDHNNQVDLQVKDSTECRLLDGYEFDQYSNHLRRCFELYSNRYEFAGKQAPSWGLRQHMQIQHYAPGQGYHQWHYERAGCDPLISTRHLVFMTYLNTVDSGGETEFYYQKLLIQPQAGLTLIWPVDWTFTHRGLTSPTQDKYIITGWMNFQ
jgi:hypothetical protein